jgi:hypothetical protein
MGVAAEVTGGRAFVGVSFCFGGWVKIEERREEKRGDRRRRSRGGGGD